MSRMSQSDPELTHRLGRRGMLGVAAGTTAAALLGAAAGPAAATPAAAPAASADPVRTRDRGHGHGRGRPVLPPGRLGIQLYSLRDKVSTLGFAPVFAELERYGYDEIEFAGYTQGSAGAITLAQLKRLARDHGLNPIGSHVGYYSGDPNAYTFAQNLTKVLDDAQALGLRHIGTAAGPFRYGSTVDAWKRAAEDFNTYGAAARARGMKFYQHNHSEEFSFATDDPSVRLYDVLLRETDPDLVFLEMDIYWAYVGQFRFSVRPDGKPAPFEPLDYVLRRPHRYPLFHVKDGVSDPTDPYGYRMTDVGDGDIDYRRFLSAVTRLRGERFAHHWQAEHDNPADSLTFARRSSEHLHSLRENC
ncbi:sugar phosphate isomerase/epimerase family protein [Streptomyces sp. NPDC058417]|uniref:sugar phosphate isomerase/epimerase family protein n=1 Tax=unclassified Streptomyces TaxID=2593676 RepID=UPI0036630B43